MSTRWLAAVHTSAPPLVKDAASAIQSLKCLLFMV